MHSYEPHCYVDKLKSDMCSYVIFIVHGFWMLTFSHDASGKYCIYEVAIGGAQYCKMRELSDKGCRGNTGVPHQSVPQSQYTAPSVQYLDICLPLRFEIYAKVPSYRFHLNSNFPVCRTFPSTESVLISNRLAHSPVVSKDCTGTSLRCQSCKEQRFLH